MGVQRPLYKYIFGPVRSRRLGVSLGVNHVPYKTCTYSCVYCQLGKTTVCTVTRSTFYSPEEIVGELREFLSETKESVDYVTLVPDGEPLLDRNLGAIIDGIKGVTSLPVAVFTNGALLYLEDARVDLLGADLVSVKVDAVTETRWRSINRPHGGLSLERVLEGVADFARAFKGRLATETMLVDGFNAELGELELIANYVRDLNPWKAYISVPVRPPTEPCKKPPPEVLVEAYAVFAKKLGEKRVELLNVPEPPEYRVYGDPESWLLNLVSVHPLRLDHALRALGDLVDHPEQLVRKLEAEGKVRVVFFEGVEFIVRAR